MQYLPNISVSVETRKAGCPSRAHLGFHGDRLQRSRAWRWASFEVLGLLVLKREIEQGWRFGVGSGGGMMERKSQQYGFRG